MIKVEVKYYGRPIKLNDIKTDIVKYVSDYTVDEYIDPKDDSDNPENNIRKEVTQIFKKYEGIYSIKFYNEEINGQ